MEQWHRCSLAPVSLARRISLAAITSYCIADTWQTKSPRILILIHVLQAGAITQGEKGQELSDIEGMVKAGIPALSEDGKSVMNTRLCKEAMEVAEKFNVPIFAHCEDIDLRGDGCMNEDENAGIPAFTIPSISESSCPFSPCVMAPARSEERVVFGIATTVVTPPLAAARIV